MNVAFEIEFYPLLKYREEGKTCDIMYIFFFQMPNKYGAAKEKCNAVSESFKYSCTQVFAVSTLFFLSGIIVCNKTVSLFGLKTKINFLMIMSFIETHEYAATLILSLLPSSGLYRVIWSRFLGCQATSRQAKVTSSNPEHVSTQVQHIDGTS